MYLSNIITINMIWQRAYVFFPSPQHVSRIKITGRRGFIPKKKNIVVYGIKNQLNPNTLLVVNEDGIKKSMKGKFSIYSHFGVISKEAWENFPSPYHMRDGKTIGRS